MDIKLKAVEYYEQEAEQALLMAAYDPSQDGELNADRRDQGEYAFVTMLHDAIGHLHDEELGHRKVDYILSIVPQSDDGLPNAIFAWTLAKQICNRLRKILGEDVEIRISARKLPAEEELSQPPFPEAGDERQDIPTRTEPSKPAPTELPPKPDDNAIRKSAGYDMDPEVAKSAKQDWASDADISNSAADEGRTYKDTFGVSPESTFGRNRNRLLRALINEISRRTELLREAILDDGRKFVEYAEENTPDQLGTSITSQFYALRPPKSGDDTAKS